MSVANKSASSHCTIYSKEEGIPHKNIDLVDYIKNGKPDFTIYFDLDSAFLKPEEITKLIEFGKKFETNRENIITYLIGYTDVTGSIIKNDHLSSERIKSVLLELIQLGFKRNQIISTSLGEVENVSSKIINPKAEAIPDRGNVRNDNIQDTYKDRKVEIRVIEKITNLHEDE